MYNSSEEPTNHLECSRGFGAQPFGSEIDVAGVTSEVEVRGRASKKGGLMDNFRS